MVWLSNMPIEEIAGRFDGSPFQAALPPGHMAGTHRQKLGQPHTALWISD
jgi:hypothetical protein